MSARVKRIEGVALLVSLGAALGAGAATFPLEPGELVLTSRSYVGLPGHPPEPYVVTIVDVRDPACDPTAIIGGNWPTQRYSNAMPNPTANPADEWRFENLGAVFGVTFDDAIPPSIYVAASTAYGDGAATGRIHRLDGTTGAISLFATLPNTGPGLGNITFDRVHGQFFVTNHEDGRIYRLDRSGAIRDTFDPFLPDAGDPGYAPLGERLWAVAVHESRVYFSVWVEDANRIDPLRANSIWSVAIDSGTGAFVPADLTSEIDLPPLLPNAYTSPVSDLAFSPGGNLLLAERSMISDTGPSAHMARVLEHAGGHGNWAPSGATFLIGELVPLNNSSGGADYTCPATDSCNPVPRVWVTGDALIWPNDPIYGIQGLPAGGGSIADSYLVDLNGILDPFNKSGYGALEMLRDCPPPQACRFALPTAVPLGPIEVCLGDRVFLDGSSSSGCQGGPLEYRWSDGTSVLCDWSPIPTCDVIATATTVYTLEVRCINDPDCYSREELRVAVTPVPVPALRPFDFICSGGFVFLDATDSNPSGCSFPIQYRFLSGATVLCDWSNNPLCGPFSPASPTSYTVEVTCGTCAASLTLDLQVWPQSVAAAGSDRTVCANAAVTLDASASTAASCTSGLLFEWWQGATLVRAASSDPTYIPPTGTPGTLTYTVWVYCDGVSLCFDSDDVVVTVRACPLAVNFGSVRAVPVRQDGVARVEVRWHTTSEDDTLGFTVERGPSASGPFATVGLPVAAHGSGLDYALIDSQPDGAAWYRVIELTSNGTGQMSAAVPLERGSPSPRGSTRRRAQRGSSR